MERELNKLFNDTNYDKENMIIRDMINQTLIPKLFLRSLFKLDSGLKGRFGSGLLYTLLFSRILWVCPSENFDFNIRLFIVMKTSQKSWNLAITIISETWVYYWIMPLSRV